ncbi:hypothetical protein BJ742DRAFT_849625 [Cladochytrium replicatum]|nr:hypothetical protein BJ742DRAFT_849625 [Cladochytrium replicatum]
MPLLEWPLLALTELARPVELHSTDSAGLSRRDDYSWVDSKAFSFYALIAAAAACVIGLILLISLVSWCCVRSYKKRKRMEEELRRARRALSRTRSRSRHYDLDEDSDLDSVLTLELEAPRRQSRRISKSAKRSSTVVDGESKAPKLLTPVVTPEDEASGRNPYRGSLVFIRGADGTLERTNLSAASLAPVDLASGGLPFRGPPASQIVTLEPVPSPYGDRPPPSLSSSPRPTSMNRSLTEPQTAYTRHSRSSWASFNSNPMSPPPQQPSVGEYRRTSGAVDVYALRPRPTQTYAPYVPSGLRAAMGPSDSLPRADGNGERVSALEMFRADNAARRAGSVDRRVMFAESAQPRAGGPGAPPILISSGRQQQQHQSLQQQHQRDELQQPQYAQHTASQHTGYNGSDSEQSERTTVGPSGSRPSDQYGGDAKVSSAKTSAFAEHMRGHFFSNPTSGRTTTSTTNYPPSSNGSTLVPAPPPTDTSRSSMSITTPGMSPILKELELLATPLFSPDFTLDISDRDAMVRSTSVQPSQAATKPSAASNDAPKYRAFSDETSEVRVFEENSDSSRKSSPNTSPTVVGAAAAATAHEELKRQVEEEEARRIDRSTIANVLKDIETIPTSPTDATLHRTWFESNSSPAHSQVMSPTTPTQQTLVQNEPPTMHESASTAESAKSNSTATFFHDDHSASAAGTSITDSPTSFDEQVFEDAMKRVSMGDSTSTGGMTTPRSTLVGTPASPLSVSDMGSMQRSPGGAASGAEVQRKQKFVDYLRQRMSEIEDGNGTRQIYASLIEKLGTGGGAGGTISEEDSDDLKKAAGVTSPPPAIGRYSYMSVPVVGKKTSPPSTMVKGVPGGKGE